MRTQTLHVSKYSDKRRISTNAESTSYSGSDRPLKARAPPSPREPAESNLEPGQAVFEAVNNMHKELDEKSLKNAVNRNLSAGTSDSNSVKTPGDPPYVPTFVVDLEPELDKDDWLWGSLRLGGDTLASHRILSLHSTLAGISGTSKVYFCLTFGTLKLIRTGIDSKRLNKKVGEMFNEALRTGKVIICPNTSSNFYNYSMHLIYSSICLSGLMVSVRTGICQLLERIRDNSSTDYTQLKKSCGNLGLFWIGEQYHLPLVIPSPWDKSDELTDKPRAKMTEKRAREILTAINWTETK